ncbi:MAG: hypothetical protein KDD50_15345, partial [Bdellovibrionales bacterium]|nr:hypothetical protein [Bdellovibrionales bacterium]
ISLNIVRWKIANYTALEGPGMDILPLLNRWENSKYLVNDFFTNASVEQNPKHIFAHIIWFVHEIVGGHWYKAIFILKLILVILTPIVWFLFLRTSIRRLGGPENSWVIGLLVGIPILNDILGYNLVQWFSIAWWPAYSDSVSPNNISIMLFLSGFILLHSNFKFRRVPCWCLYSASAFIHPSAVLMSLFFVSVIETSRYVLNPKYSKNFKIYLDILTPIFVSLVFLRYLYNQPDGVPISIVKEAYVYLGHSSHYLVQNLGSLTGYSWKWSFLLNLLVSMGILLMYPKSISFKKRLIMICLIWSVFNLAILIQYLSVTLQLSKIFLYIGITRFFEFSYWLLAILVSIPMSHLAQKYIRIRSIAWVVRLLFCCIIGVLLTLSTQIKMDDPLKSVKLENKELFAFIQNSTDQKAVFAVPFGELTRSVPLVVKRAIYAGYGFPFNEKFFAEYIERESLMYGTFQERQIVSASWIGGAMAKIYQSRSPDQFYRYSKSHRLDYVIVESAFLKKFGAYSPVFSGLRYTIFSVDSLEPRGQHE